MTRLLQRIGSAWHALTAKSAPPASAYSYAWGGGSAWADAFRSRRAPTPAELVDSYKSLVYACANLNAQAVARTPLRLYAVTRSRQQRPKCQVAEVGRKTNERLKRLSYAARTIAGAQHVEEVTEHPLLDALLKVNDDLDYAQLIAYTVLSLDIVGSAYWWPALGKFRTPEEFWALPPHLVFPVFTSGTMVPDAYTFGGLTYPKADLIRFRRLSAKNPYGQGYGPHQAAIEYARLEDTFVSIQDNLLANGPRPSLIVSHKDPKGAFGPAERQRLEADMERRGRGGRAGSVFVVDGAAAVAPVSYSPADLGGLQVSAYDMERIANCFDVPVSMLKTEDVNRANAEAGLAQHGRHAVEPRCKLIASALTRWTHSLDARGRLGWGRLFWAFDATVAEDKAAEAELHRTYIDLGVLTRNEVRLELGYAPVEGGDVLLVPSNLARLTDIPAEHDDEANRGGSVVPGTESGNESDDRSLEGKTETEFPSRKTVLGSSAEDVLRAIKARPASTDSLRTRSTTRRYNISYSHYSKFNPNHDPEGGRFIPGSGAGSGGSEQQPKKPKRKPKGPKRPKPRKRSSRQNETGVHNLNSQATPGPNKVFGLSKARQLRGYDDTDLSKAAIEFRKTERIGRKGNVAIIEYELYGETHKKGFHTVDKSSLHTEFRAWYWLPEEAKLKRLFTERQPCQYRSPNCDSMLSRQFPEAEITFIFEYGDEASRKRGNKALKSTLRGLGL